MENGFLQGETKKISSWRLDFFFVKPCKKNFFSDSTHFSTKIILLYKIWFAASVGKNDHKNDDQEFPNDEPKEPDSLIPNDIDQSESNPDEI